MEGNASSFPINMGDDKASPSSMTKPSAIIFDMDETLVDTAALWRRAESGLLESLGHTWTATRAARYKGRNVADVAAFIHADVGADGPVEEWQRFFREALFRAFEEGPIVPMPGAAACVRRLGEIAPLAVASGSPLPLIELAMNRLALRDAFRVLISSEAVPRGKPHPDVFLAAAQELRVPPETCLVIEDSLAGARAAQSAGMACFVVPSVQAPELPGVATRVFASLDEILEGDASL